MCHKREIEETAILNLSGVSQESIIKRLRNHGAVSCD